MCVLYFKDFWEWWKDEGIMALILWKKIFEKIRYNFYTSRLITEYFYILCYDSTSLMNKEQNLFFVSLCWT